MSKRARPAAEVTERRPARELTDAELQDETERVAQALRELFDRWAERDERRKREVSR